MYANSPPQGQTLADFTSRAATAANNVSPNAPAAPAGGASGAGQIGGTTAPAAAPAATPTKSAASNLIKSSWGLVCVAVAAMLVL
jgi:hypothetical protein